MPPDPAADGRAPRRIQMSLADGGAHSRTVSPRAGSPNSQGSSGPAPPGRTAVAIAEHIAPTRARLDDWKEKSGRTRAPTTWTETDSARKTSSVWTTSSTWTTTETEVTTTTFLSFTTEPWATTTTTDFSTSPLPSETIGPPAPPFPYPGRPGDDVFYLQDSSIKGLYYQVVLAMVFWIAMIAIFVLGRMLGKSGRRIFATRWEVMRKETPEFMLNPFKCFMNVYRVTDKDIIQNVGLDAMVGCQNSSRLSFRPNHTSLPKMFLKFLRVSFYVLAMITLVVFPVITPMNYYATIPEDERPKSPSPSAGNGNDTIPPPNVNYTDPITRFASTGLVRFTIANVQPGSKLLIAHTVFTYLVTAIFFGWLYTTYRDYVALENDYMKEDSTLRSRRERKNELVQFRTIMVRDIPKPLRTDAQLEDYFSKLGIGEVQYAVMDRKVDPDLEHMIKEREAVLSGLENAYVEWHTRVEKERTGRKGLWETLSEAAEQAWKGANGYARAKRRSNGDLDGAVAPSSSSVAHAHGSLDGSDSERSGSEDGENAPLTGRTKENSPEALRPKHWVGRRFWFLGGREVDSIDYYTNRFAFLNAEIDRKRKLALNDESVQYNSSGFVTFRTQRSATIASQVLLRSSTNAFTMTTHLAPHPHDVVWGALNFSLHQKVIQSFCVTVLILVMTFFWGIPIGFISTFTSLSSLSKVPFLKPLLDQILKIEWLNIILQTLLPPLLFRLFLAIVPNLIQYLIDLEGIEARSWKELAVFDRFYTFLVFNVLFVFVLSNAVYNFIGGLFDNPISIIKLLGTVLPKGASFFTNYAVYTSSYFAWELGRPMVILLYVWRRRTCRTPREFFHLNRETSYIDYGVYYPYHLNMLVICIVYSVQAPIILIPGLFYFGFGYLVYKHQLVYVYVKEWENHGRHWPLVFNRTVFGLIIFQLVMIGLLAVKQSALNAMAVIPLLLATMLFYTYCNRAFAKRTQFVPLDQLRREGRSRTASGSRVVASTESLTAPSLFSEEPEAIEDYEEAINATASQASPTVTPTAAETVVILPGSGSTAEGQDPNRRLIFRGNANRRIRAFTGDHADIGMSRHKLYINPAFSSDLPQPWLPAAVVSELPASDPLSLFAPLYDDLGPQQTTTLRSVGGVEVGPGNSLGKMLVGSARELEELGHEAEDHSDDDDGSGDFADDDNNIVVIGDEEALLGSPSLGQTFASRLSVDGSRSRRASTVGPMLSTSANLFENAWSSPTPPGNL